MRFEVFHAFHVFSGAFKLVKEIVYPLCYAVRCDVFFMATVSIHAVSSENILFSIHGCA